MVDHENEELKWTTCCRGRKNCPQLAISNSTFDVFIRDDDGNTIRLAPAQLDGVVETLMETLACLRGWYNTKE